MVLSCESGELKRYIKRQLENFFPFQTPLAGNDVEQAFSLALERAEYCFDKCVYYCNGAGECVFSPMHSDQYSQFLYFFASSLWEISQNKAICDQIILLNKALNGLFYSYKTKLPDVFFFSHPVGTILGSAEYSNYLVILQNVTINTGTADNGRAAPYLGAGLFCGAGAKIIGSEPVGKRVSVGVNAVVYHEAIPDDSVIYVNESGQKRIVPNKKQICTAQSYFNVPII